MEDIQPIYARELQGSKASDEQGWGQTEGHVFADLRETKETSSRLDCPSFSIFTGVLYKIRPSAEAKKAGTLAWQE